MDREALVRRLVHCLIAVTPVYYLLPEELPLAPFRRWHLLIAFFLVIAAVESIRLWRKATFFGLRPHEKHSIASFAWAAAGITIALWLMPWEIATPVLIGMGLVDPLAGELRRTGRPRCVAICLPMSVYATICAVTLWALTDVTMPLILALSAVGASLAVPAERWRSHYVDDDFLMIVVPGAIMSLLWLAV
ncbi:TPA: hypothetical protein HA259_07035 [Thermoplasmata archaeon]|nr:hypothetical protein [Thermoplasmata archaeon]